MLFSFISCFREISIPFDSYSANFLISLILFDKLKRTVLAKNDNISVFGESNFGIYGLLFTLVFIRSTALSNTESYFELSNLPIPFIPSPAT